jgi:hypothetical protein
MTRFWRWKTGVALILLIATTHPAKAQENYEIQVYGYDTVPPKHTMLEFHTNFTANGSKSDTNGLNPTNHAWHETIEITHGFYDWFETGFYIFTAARSGDGWQWVGDHIRPRVRIPERWHWPVGISLSNEIGYQRRSFSEDTWTWEMRPVIDKEAGPWYVSFNPTLERSFHGENVHQGVEFSPNLKVGYDFTSRISGGFEYYGGLGPITGFDPIGEQGQQIFPSIDLDLAPQWEVNFGIGFGMTGASDHLILKSIIGYRFNF